jgi:hypothetical protein
MTNNLLNGSVPRTIEAAVRLDVEMVLCAVAGIGTS